MVARVLTKPVAVWLAMMMGISVKKSMNAIATLVKMADAAMMNWTRIHVTVYQVWADHLIVITFISHLSMDCNIKVK